MARTHGYATPKTPLDRARPTQDAEKYAEDVKPYLAKAV